MKDSDFQKRFERKQQNRQVHGQRLTVFYRQMDSDFPLSSLVKLMLRRCENSVSPSLYRQMADSLVGFEEALQVEMADSLTDCVQGVAIYTTGIKHVDRILWPLYHKIQREMANNNISKVNR
jgi:hypothetical protein